MALGGGTFVTQNKVLPGSYINVVSVKSTRPDNSRGVATLALELNWGPDVEVFGVDAENFADNALKIFGYQYNRDELAYVREVIKHATTVYFYKLNSDGTKASCKHATAKYSGIRGNDIKIVITSNIDDISKFDVKTYVDAQIVDEQTVSSASELADNDFVIFDKEEALTLTAGINLTGGANGTVDGDSHKKYLDAMESYRFNAMGCMAIDDDIKKVYVEYTKRMRNDNGIKFQCVVFNLAADFEGVINVKNSVDIIPWIVGVQAACDINRACANMLYDGEIDVKASYKQSQLETAISNGEFVLHKCGTEVRILTDINSLVTETEDKGELFKQNQTIRIIDELAMRTADIFNTKYLGSILNDDNGRASFWAELVQLHREFVTVGAIENFSESDITIAKGEKKGSVVVTDIITIVGTMEQLYMTVSVQ